MKTFPTLLVLCAGNSPMTGEFPAQRPVMRSFDVFFDLHLNKRLCKQSWGWWFETPSSSLWRHCNDVQNWHQSSYSVIVTQLWLAFVGRTGLQNIVIPHTIHEHNHLVSSHCWVNVTPLLMQWTYTSRNAKPFAFTMWIRLLVLPY